MALGDNFLIHIGTAAGNRQPTSGVEEQVSAIMKPSATDPVEMYNGSVERDIMYNQVITTQDNSDATQRHNNDYNISLMITNGIYIRKQGSTDVVAISGVQFNV